MRTLVTGATGFVGSYLTRQLLQAGHEVAVVCRPQSDLTRLGDAVSSIHRLHGDLRNLAEMESAIRSFAPEVIFHLAWHGVGNQQRNDAQQIDFNLPGSLALVRLAIELDCRAFVGLGSQAEYGPQNTIIDEWAPTRPTTMYGAAKLSTCLLSQQIAAASAMRFVWLRLFSSYGPGDSPDWMIPQLIHKLLRGERMALTAGEQRWDYIFVSDAAAAIARCGFEQQAQGIYNLGSGEAHTIRSIVESIRDQIDPTLPLGFGEVPYRPDQVMHLQANIDRLRADTGWSPQVSLAEGLRQTIEWYMTAAKVSQIAV